MMHFEMFFRWIKKFLYLASGSYLQLDKLHSDFYLQRIYKYLQIAYL